MRHLPAFLAALAVGSGAFALERAARAERIAVVTASPASSEAARYLDEQLDAPLDHRESENARSLDALRREARAGWHDDLIVVLDTEQATVSVLRPGDGARSSRTLAPEAASEPYVVALAAVELLGIVRATPLLRTAYREAPPKPESRDLPPPPLPPPPPARPPRQPWIGLELGLLSVTGSNGDISLLEPTAGVDALVFRPSWTTWLSLGVHGAGLSSMKRDQVLVLASGVDSRGAVEYSRDEIALRATVGRRDGDFAALGSADVGLAFPEARALSSVGGAERTIAESRRTSFWLGGTAELRYAFVGELSIGVAAGAAWLPETTRFHAAPQGSNAVTALSESSLDLRARVSLVWGILP